MPPAVGSGVSNEWSNYIDLRHVRQQNKDLQQQLTRMRIEEAAIAEDARQGRRLQAMLRFRETYVGSTVAAQVIGASGSDQSRVLTIDKGSRDGLKPDMPVITQDGIVGKIRDVDPTTAHVLEINDQTSGAGVILQSTRIRAILRGNIAGRAQIGNLTADSRIKPGEQVLTSGGDQVYPRGLPVGTIESIAPDPDHQPGTASAATPAQGTPAAPVVLTVPHPPPTVHPDRFTPGSTPPASALTPGAPHPAAPAQPQSQQSPASRPNQPSNEPPPSSETQPQPESPK